MLERDDERARRASKDERKADQNRGNGASKDDAIRIDKKLLQTLSLNARAHRTSITIFIPAAQTTASFVARFSVP
jgi:hypothetical protein